MAKKIFCTEADIQAFLQSAEAQLAFARTELKKKKFQNAKEKEVSLVFKVDDGKDDRKATLSFSRKAWIKMYALVNNFTSEVEWHGTVERIDEFTFLIKDILIFPHEATGSTVTTNQKEYEDWLNDLDDETFNSLRFHGHSHVDMGVFPSGVDTSYRNNVLNNFGTPTPETDLFYIFLIANKKGAISAEIYDLQNNALYDTDEITIEVEIDDDEYLCEFMSEAKNAVKAKTYGFNGGSTYPVTNPPSAPPQGTSSGSKMTSKFKSKYSQDSLFDDVKEDDFDYDNYWDDYYKTGGKK